ncbi:hypothetical protein WJX72_007731 [[Myrmecia] bisecta]|uniref:Uncharacterized protein n=1 Tax=[Myrmecia] bisecta TaxID=41462 RepID=A0AAW1QFT0_9CHLO
MMYATASSVVLATFVGVLRGVGCLFEPHIDSSHPATAGIAGSAAGVVRTLSNVDVPMKASAHTHQALVSGCTAAGLFVLRDVAVALERQNECSPPAQPSVDPHKGA